MHHDGNLTITRNNAGDFANLTSVGGEVDIGADAHLPALTSVGGSLYIGADAHLPALTSVGGSLYIGADAQLPALTSVGGEVDIGADAHLPALTSVGGELYIKADAQLPALTSVGCLPLPDAAIARKRLIAIAHQVLADPNTLDMSTWHTCETTHCLGGWAVHNEGDAGLALEKKYGISIAATHLLGVQGASLFHVDDDRALAALRELVRVKTQGEQQ